MFSIFIRGNLYRQTNPGNPNKNRTKRKKIEYIFGVERTSWIFGGIKKTARTSQKEEEVGELPRATEVTGGRRSLKLKKPPLTKPLDKEVTQM
ncbi:MAG: hypothetical protein ACYTEU_04870 [Planctomycetota bacterium]|jgi:hypothetical protein